jgi:ABC-type transport system involved in multi-copper enzyme maturation permease subunit
MSTLTTHAGDSPATTRAGAERGGFVPAYAARPAPAPIPFARLLKVELRKMFDTRSGLWLMASIGILAALASAAVVLWAPDDQVTYETFAAAVGFPMAVLLPVIAVLAVTSEWSQRNGLTTFTLVPHRGRVVAAKAVGALLVAVGGMLVAAAVGVLGNLVGSALNGTDAIWDVSASDFTAIVLANVLGVFLGFMLGAVLRSSPAALVGYLVLSFVLVPLTMTLAAAQQWFADIQPWVDWNFTQSQLFEGLPTDGEYWAQLGVTTTVWLLLPLAWGLWRLVRDEVK